VSLSVPTADALDDTQGREMCSVPRPVCTIATRGGAMLNCYDAAFECYWNPHSRTFVMTWRPFSSIIWVLFLLSYNFGSLRGDRNIWTKHLTRFINKLGNVWIDQQFWHARTVIAPRFSIYECWLLLMPYKQRKTGETGEQRPPLSNLTKTESNYEIT
jgi:hypothetical protein